LIWIQGITDGIGMEAVSKVMASAQNAVHK